MRFSRFCVLASLVLALPLAANSAPACPAFEPSEGPQAPQSAVGAAIAAASALSPGDRIEVLKHEGLRLMPTMTLGELGNIATAIEAAGRWRPSFLFFRLDVPNLFHVIAVHEARDELAKAFYDQYGLNMLPHEIVTLAKLAGDDERDPILSGYARQTLRPLSVDDILDLAKLASPLTADAIIQDFISRSSRLSAHDVARLIAGLSEEHDETRADAMMTAEIAEAIVLAQGIRDESERGEALLATFRSRLAAFSHVEFSPGHLGALAGAAGDDAKNEMVEEYMEKWKAFLSTADAIYVANIASSDEAKDAAILVYVNHHGANIPPDYMIRLARAMNDESERDGMIETYLGRPELLISETDAIRVASTATAQGMVAGIQAYRDAEERRARQHR